MAQRDGDREHVRPLPRRHAIEVAHQLGEEVVWKEFVDDQLQERARPGELLRTCGKQPDRTGTKLLPPSFGIELLFGSGGFFEVVVEIDHGTTDLAHGCSSTKVSFRQACVN